MGTPPHTHTPVQRGQAAQELINKMVAVSKSRDKQWCYVERGRARSLQGSHADQGPLRSKGHGPWKEV